MSDFVFKVKIRFHHLPCKEFKILCFDINDWAVINVGIFIPSAFRAKHSRIKKGLQYSAKNGYQINTLGVLFQINRQ